MKPQVLQLNPILIPQSKTSSPRSTPCTSTSSCPIQRGWLRQHEDHRSMPSSPAATPAFQRADGCSCPPSRWWPSTGVEGTDAVDLAYCRARANCRSPATLGALTEDVADLAIALAARRPAATCLWRRATASCAPASGCITPAGAIPLARAASAACAWASWAWAAWAARSRCVRPPSAARSRYTDLRAMDDVALDRFVPDLLELARESDALVLCAAADKAEGIIDAAVLDALGPARLPGQRRARPPRQRVRPHAGAGRLAALRGRGSTCSSTSRACRCACASPSTRDPAGPSRQRHVGDPHRHGRDGARPALPQAFGGAHARP